MLHNRRSLLELDEGRVKCAYRDSMSFWTAGVGHLVDKRKGGKLPAFLLDRMEPQVIAEFAKLDSFPTSVKVYAPACLTDAQVDALLDYDIQVHEAELQRQIPWTSNFKVVQPVRYEALLNMFFNLGPNLLGFKNTLECVRTGHWPEAVANMKASKWWGQVGSRAKRLASMMESGKWPAR
jgi:lysozyme